MPADTPVAVTLNETPTFWLLDRDSLSAAVGSDAAAALEQDKERVAALAATALTFNEIEVQTGAVWLRSTGTNLSRPRRKNAMVQASSWDIFDAEQGTCCSSFFLVCDLAMTPTSPFFGVRVSASECRFF